MTYILQESQLIAVILFIVFKELLKYPAVSQFKRFVEVVEKNKTFRFLRN